MKSLGLLFFAWPCAAFAFSAQVSTTTYDEAGKAPTFLRFDIPTKKLFFSSHVTGYARKFSATAALDGGKLRDALVAFDAHDLDTDLYARNDQMWNFCLGYKDNPRIEVRLPDVAFTEGKSVQAAGTMRVRGKEKPLPVEITLARKAGHWVVDGVAHTSFEALAIPDPSIGVASVNGPIDISFHLEEL